MLVSLAASPNDNNRVLAFHTAVPSIVCVAFPAMLITGAPTDSLQVQSLRQYDPRYRFMQMLPQILRGMGNAARRSLRMLTEVNQLTHRSTDAVNSH